MESIYQIVFDLYSTEGPMWDTVKQLPAKPVLRAGKATGKNYTVKTYSASVVEISLVSELV